MRSQEWIKSEKDAELLGLARTLTKMRKHERIPMSERQEAIRAQLVKSSDEIRLCTFETRLGWISVAYSARGIVSLLLPRASRALALRDLQRGFPDRPVDDNAPENIVRELKEYGEGRRRVFDLPLDWSSIKPFQRAVLQATNRIPFGETRSYAWVAEKIGKPSASRAVGQALGANPIPIILPCHRVIGSDGGLHGYGGGIEMKERLLKLEGGLLA